MMEIQESEGKFPVITELTLGDCRAEVSYDECGAMYASPRENDNVGVMACAHPRYDLGDKEGEAILSELQAECESWAEAYGYLMEKYGATVVMPLYLLDHSMITMSCGHPFEKASRDHYACDPGGWDTSIVGVIFDTDERRKVMGTPKDRVQACLEGEVEEYAKYLEGEVYAVEVFDRHGNHSEDRGGGWIIGYEYAVELARDELAIEYGYARREDARVQEWAADMGRTLKGYLPIGLPVGVPE